MLIGSRLSTSEHVILFSFTHVIDIRGRMETNSVNPYMINFSDINRIRIKPIDLALYQS
jgi:hypothetical protein